MQIGKLDFPTNRVDLLRHQSPSICVLDHQGPVAILTFDLIVDC